MKRKQVSEILNLGKYKRKADQLRYYLSLTGKEYKCESCGIEKWMGQDLVIEIHHKDGNPLNNTETNLQYLCPNCHSLTPNFYHTKRQYFCKCGNTITKRYKSCKKCARKGEIRLDKRKVVRPNSAELYKLVWSKPTSQIAKDFGVSDKAIEKWCKSYKIDKPPRGYWAKVRDENQ